MDYFIYSISYLVTLIGGHFFVWIWLRKYNISGDEGLKGAGARIGILERALTLTFVLTGNYTAIAVIFAAKSIARFKELEKRHFAEYYLIGTLSSILFALLVGILTKYWLTL